MNKPLEHVAEMTRSRDRAMVDATLLSAFMDLLPVRQVSLWRVLGEPGSPQVWVLSGSHLRGELMPKVDTLGDPSFEPRPFEALPLHCECYEQVQIEHLQLDAAYGVLLPMASEREMEGVVELVLEQPLDLALQRMAQSVLKIHRNFLGLLDYSERDTLTGLLNRRSFDETFLRATAMEAASLFAAEHADDEERRRRGERHHWLGVIDIDHFKRVNDTHGHLIGDEVLLLVARIMRSTFRYDDRLYRFGGEEFVVLLTAPDDASAGAAFERLRSQVENYAFPRVGRIDRKSVV
jgi:diguanylate cyclase (GGDEF)-like protein